MEIDYNFEPKSRMIEGKLNVTVVVDDSIFQEWFDGLSDEEKKEYWDQYNKIQLPKNDNGKTASGK